MKLYVCADGSYAGTQAEAKAKGKGWMPEEVPTDKAGLIAYLNENRHLHELECPDPTRHSEPLPVYRPEQHALVTLTDAEEFIQSADAGTLARLADNVCWRLKELLKGITK